MEQPLPSFDGKSSTEAYRRYRIEDRSFFSIIKNDLARQARSLGFSRGKAGKLQIVVAELLSNLLKFGTRNRELLWKPIWDQHVPGIEILALDKGPGIPIMSQAMEDGFSTSGTAGEGLGAIKRQSDFFELYTQPEQGTVVLARIFETEEVHFRPHAFNFAALSVAKPGEELCGDGYYIEFEPEQQLFNILILDGLGHGPGAHEASQAAIKAYKSLPDHRPCAALRAVHQQIKKTRGAVAMALKYQFHQEMLSYCGAGNIIGKMINFQNIKHLSSFNGIVGHVMSGNTQDHEILWERGNLLILHSDGIRSRWEISKYPHIQKYDPAILAACLYRDQSRGNDDTTIIISKHPGIDGKGSKTNY